MLAEYHTMRRKAVILKVSDGLTGRAYRTHSLSFLWVEGQSRHLPPVCRSWVCRLCHQPPLPLSFSFSVFLFGVLWVFLFGGFSFYFSSFFGSTVFLLYTNEKFVSVVLGPLRKPLLPRHVRHPAVCRWYQT